jgi:hypothetical protein
MAGPSKRMRISNEEVFYELLQENEYSDISENDYSCDSEINLKIFGHTDLFLWLLLPHCLVHKTTQNILGVYWSLPNQHVS